MDPAFKTGEVYAGTIATHVEEPGPCLGSLVVPWLDRGIQFNNCAYLLQTARPSFCVLDDIT